MKDKISNIKSNSPVSLLIHGSNDISIGIAKSLIEQGGSVIIVDQFNSRSKKYITELKALGRADFIDFKGFDDLLTTLNRVDYIFYFLHDFLNSNKDFSSKDFLEETTNLNTTLKATKKFDSKLSLVTKIKLNQDLTAHILNSKLSSPSPYSPIELQKYCETLTAESRDKLKINARIIRLGTILGGENVDQIDETITRLINESINKPELTIYGEGLDIHYLIHNTDAIYGILKLTFTEKTEGEVISLANNHDYTTLSVAYKLLELNPDTAQIKFLPAKEGNTIIFDQYIPAVNASVYGWNQKIPIEQSLAQAIATFDKEKGQKILDAPNRILNQMKIDQALKKSEVVHTPIGKAVNIVSNPIVGVTTWLKSKIIGEEGFTFKKGLKFGLLLVVISTLFYFIFAPITGIAIGSYLLYKNSQNALTSVNEFDFKNASIYLDKAESNANNNESYLTRIEWIFNFTGKQKIYENTSQLLFASEYALSGASNLTKALDPLAQYAKEFKPSIDFDNTIPNSSREYRIYLKELEGNLRGLDKASYNINIATQLLSKVEVAVFPKIVQPYLAKIKIANEQIINQVVPAQKILSFVPNLLGVDKRQRYLILFQNPGEIRSTGGWLSSYAIVSIEGGQIRELKVDDVYNAEGQLRIAGKSYDAPKDMQKALGVSKWSMSLSNWDPDFDSSAKSAQYFLTQLDPGVEFDAVIAIDTEVVKKLLDKWGGLTVAGESTPVTSSNLDERIFQLHKDFTPGESIKSTFLANLANETLKKIFTLDFNGYASIANVITESLNQKHLLVYISEKDANKFFEQSGWSGNLSDKYQWAPIPIEWNWGANKANLYIERNHTLNVNVKSENQIDYEYTLFVKNKSNSTIYPQGNYENYFRIYLPRDAKVSSIKGYLNNKYTTYNEAGFKVIGGWFNIPAKSTQSFQIKYTLERNQDSKTYPITRSEQDKSMELVIFKQPGTMSDIYDLSIIYPESWAVLKYDGLSRAINTLTSRFVLDTDKKIVIDWEEK